METIQNQDQLEANQISVTSYNILADLYTDPWYFPYCAQKYLIFEYRKLRIVEEITTLNSDIVCLQEVDHFPDFYQQEFERLGYECFYTPKPIRNEGILIMFKKDKFLKISDYVINFDELIPEQLKSDHYKRNNNAQIMQLKHIVTGTQITMANTHLFWNPQNEEVKLLQSATILHYLTKNFKEDDNVFLCGDFNSMPTSNVTLYISQKKEPLLNRVEKQFQKDIKIHEMKFIYNMFRDQNLFDLRSSYSNYQGSNKHPQFTNYTKNFNGTLDYIYYNPNMKDCELIGIKDIPIDQAKKQVGLPSKDFPSDHLPITAFFNIKQCTQKTEISCQTEQNESKLGDQQTQSPNKDIQTQNQKL